MNTEDFVDRRKHKRYQVKDGVYAINSCKSGLITDISMGGLTFRYIDRKELSKQPCELDILYEADDFYLDRIPFISVSDFLAKSETPDGALVVKRHAIRFTGMTESQKEQLGLFIQKHTMEKKQQDTLAA